MSLRYSALSVEGYGKGKEDGQPYNQACAPHHPTPTHLIHAPQPFSIQRRVRVAHALAAGRRRRWAVRERPAYFRRL